MFTELITFDNPLTLQISQKDFALIPAEGEDSLPLLIQQKGEKVKISICDEPLTTLADILKGIYSNEADDENYKNSYVFDNSSDLNQVLSGSIENLWPIIEILFNSSWISTGDFIELLQELKKKYSIEYILTCLSNFSTGELHQLVQTPSICIFESFL